MCGRARCVLNAQTVQSVIPQVGQSSWKDGSDSYSQKENAHPGNELPVLVCGENGQPEIRLMTWGLLTSFQQLQIHTHGENGFKAKGLSKPSHFTMMNCRSETCDVKPSFKNLLKKNRCVVLLNGFYEWLTDDNKEKQPWYVHLEHQPLLCVAGKSITPNYNG
jgi:putative SOS response-associated peptidase YedK